MSDNPPYPPPSGGQPPYGPPPGQGPPAGGYPPGPPQGGYPQSPPGYGQPVQPGYGQPAYGAPYAQPGFGPPSGPSKRWYQRWWVWLIAVIAVIIIGLVVAGALVGNKYELESKIKSALRDAGHSASSVSCPNNINTGKGHSYVCTATVDGSKTSLKVTFDADRHFIVSSAG